MTEFLSRNTWYAVDKRGTEHFESDRPPATDYSAVSGISFVSTSRLTWIIDKDHTGHPTNNV